MYVCSVTVRMTRGFMSPTGRQVTMVTMLNGCVTVQMACGLTGLKSPTGRQVTIATVLER